MTTTVETIWESFASPLRSFIRARVRDHSAAEDILQEVFVKIHRKLATLQAGERIEAWVWRITRNSLADHFRRTRPTEPLPADLVGTAPESESDLPDLTPCVRRFVGELPPTYREALVLTEWNGLTQKDLAKQRTSISGAKSRVQRSRLQLKELLMDCCRFELDRRGTVLEM
jgi:RNA polymerase sigma-70 factor (ECF subfamily)